MTLEAVKFPYEFLVRWDQNGAVSGAHVQWRTVVTEDGVFAGETVGAAEPVGMTDGAAGFPLTDILSQMTADALAAVNALAAERNLLAARVAELEAASQADE